MGLMIGNTLTTQAWQHNMASTPSNNAPGTTITCGTAHTKGSYGQLISSTDYDWYGFYLIPANVTDPNLATQGLVDVAVGGAGSETVLISNCMFTTGTSLNNGADARFLPLFIPKGTRIAMRGQSVIASQTMNWTVLGMGGGSHMPWPVYQGCETIGADTANSRFASHTSGSSGSYSTYADFGGTSTVQYKAIMPLIQQHSDTTMTSLTMWVRIGIGGTTLGQWFVVWANTEYVVSTFPNRPLPMTVPSGTQFQVQATSSTTADSDFSIGLLGFY